MFLYINITYPRGSMCSILDCIIIVPCVTEVPHALASTSVSPCGVASTAVPDVMTSTSLSAVPVAMASRVVPLVGHNLHRTA